MRKAIFYLAGMFAAGILAGWLTFLVSQAYQQQLFAGAFASWERLSPPPEPFRRFLGVGRCRFVAAEFDGKAVLYIESFNNHVYQYDMCASETTWVATSLPERLEGGACEVPADTSLAPYWGRLAAPATDCWQVNWNWETVRDDTYFVRLSDETFWWWRRYVSILDSVKLVCGVPVLAAVLGVVAWHIGWRRYQRGHLARLRRTPS
jgi:hypothetical protein